MKLHLVLFIITIPIFHSCGTVQNNNSEAIFRHVNLGRLGHINLGENLSDHNHLYKVENTRYFLKENVFDGAASIELVPDSDGVIGSIIFEAYKNADKASKISEYEHLGKPTVENGNAVWNDGKTVFEIYEVESNNDTSLFLKISDIK